MEEDPMVDVKGFLSRWGLLIIIGAGVFVLSYVMWGRRNNPASTSTASLLPGQISQNGANGQPVVEYVPTTGDTYTNIDTNTYYSNGTVTPVDIIPSGIRPTRPPAPFPAPITGVNPPLPQVIPPIHPRTTPPVSPSFILYKIKSGDTLSGIASRYGVTWQSLYNFNKAAIDSMSSKRGNPIPGGPWNNIFPNEEIKIPR